MTDVRVGSEGEPVVTITEPIAPSPTATVEPTVTVIATLTPTLTPTELITSEPTATEEISPTEVVEPTEIITPTASITDEITTTVVPSEEPTVEPTEIVTDIPEPTTPITDIPSPSPTGKYTEEELFSDADGDALPFVCELHYGTDPENPDTDGDGISDYIEIVNGLNPLVTDDKLDGNFDSDCDGLYDRLELYMYFTDPLNPDTDGDELEDGFEIQNGFDPLKVDTDENGIWDGDEIFEQTFEYSLKDMDYKYGNLVNVAGSTDTIFGVERDIPDSIGAVTGIDITTNLSKDINVQFSIENLYGENVMASNIHGLIGVPFDISTDTDFEKATVIFKYDDSKLGECNEENLRLIWYNEDENHFVLLEDARLDTEKNTITYETTHFCIFAIVDFDVWKKQWEYWVRYYSKKKTETKGSTALELCIDIGSDFFKENETEIKKSLKRFIDAKFAKDSVSIVSFYQRYILVDEGIHFASEEDRKNEHMEKIELTSSKARITSYLNDVIQSQNSFCSTLGVLTSIKDYFENSDNANDKKAVIMVSTALLDPNVNNGIEEIIPYFKENNIELYQTYIGDLSSEYEANATSTLKSTGGYLREITESSNFTGILNTILNKLNGYDVVFLIDSGSNRIKEEWDRFIQGSISAVNSSTHVSRYGLINVYSGKKTDEEGEEITESDWYNEQSFYRFTTDSSILESEIDSLTPKEKSCTLQSMEYGWPADNFDETAFAYSEGTKSIILITDSVLSSESVIKKNIEDKIPLYVIYVGPEIASKEKNTMKNLIERTGGLVSFMSDYSRYKKVSASGIETELSDIEKFNDSISYMITACLHTVDGVDSDLDGLPDCDELYGMLGMTMKVIQTNPHSNDTDKDGLKDGEELGIGARVDSYFKDILGTYVSEETDLFRLFDKECSVYTMNSDPTAIDSDGDGYLDNGWSNNKTDVSRDYRPLVNDIHIYKIKDSADYVIVKENMGTFYGGNQNWYDDKTYPTVPGKTHREALLKGCGIIALLNVFIYFYYDDPLMLTNDMKTFLNQTNLMNKMVTKSDYMKWMNYLTDIDHIFDYTEFDTAGVWGHEEADYFNTYYKDLSNNVYSAEFKPFISRISENKNKEIKQKDIISMLKADIPVPFEIALSILTFLGLKQSGVFRCSRIEHGETDYDSSKESLYQYKAYKRINGKDYDLAAHWMTITEFIIDDKTGEKWMTIQNWGKKEYVNFDQWVENQFGTFADGILMIQKGR